MLYGEFTSTASVDCVVSTNNFKSIELVSADGSQHYPVSTNNRSLDESLANILLNPTEKKKVKLLVKTQQVKMKDNTFDSVSILAKYGDWEMDLILKSDDVHFKGFFKTWLLTQVNEASLVVPF